jgi:hypothetical protein
MQVKYLWSEMETGGIAINCQLPEFLRVSAFGVWGRLTDG